MTCLYSRCGSIELSLGKHQEIGLPSEKTAIEKYSLCSTKDKTQARATCGKPLLLAWQ